MSFAQTDLTHDAFLGGRVHIWQPRKGYRAATDPVWLAAACPAASGQSVLELGCGAGTALACLNARVAGLDLAGIEMQRDYAELARRNLPQGARVLEGDLSRMPPELRARRFDHVIANPPFYSAGQGIRPNDPGRETAHVEDTPLATWIDSGLRRVQDRGTFTMINRTDRLADILAPLQGRTGGVMILPLAARAGRAAERVIVQAIKGARAPLKLLPPMVVHEGDSHPGDVSHFSALASGVLREGACLSLAAI
ncbi:tRNA1(Val) (adenine(37)-N6)-methyltransferase [Pontivivens nitratireducens]|uniref:tRNA1(Val) (adenine(37)-N6)-methyltransferase n=1 Tax=Pontivivens nitratireducens TaxID=2758038 RepID=UPI001F0E9E98|nr:methyltransferase domain-containing protein [Pontibrevibacter nitratireducens]